MNVLPKLKGSFVFGIVTEDESYAVTDRGMNRPANVGVFEGGGTTVASEVTAVDFVGSIWAGEMNPAEIITMHRDGTFSREQWAEPEPDGCLLELAYLMREALTDKEGNIIGNLATFHGIEVKAFREEVGKELARQEMAKRARGEPAPLLDVDVAFGVPNTAITAGKAFAKEAGIKHRQGLIARTLDRAFISPTARERVSAVRKKIEPVKKVLFKKKSGTIEDTIVRGDTYREVADIQREAGATEVHGGVAFPPITDP
jgi:amidophosphoribosyltransferase